MSPATAEFPHPQDWEPETALNQESAPERQLRPESAMAWADHCLRSETVPEWEIDQEPASALEFVQLRAMAQVQA